MTGVDLRSVLIISIHAPSRERPVIFVITLFHVLNFNPRSLSGATGMSATAAGSSAFQSTLPLGSDYVAKYSLKKQTDFNPRSLSGAT